MRSPTNRGTRGHLAIIAILQVLMLVSTLVLTPALVVAQEGDPAAASAPQSQLYIHPDPLKLTVGDTKVVTAWSCPAGIPLPLGVDEDPANAGCQPTQAEWSLNDAAAAVAALSIEEDETGRRTRVTADSAGGGDGNTKIIATLGDLTYKAELILKTPEPTAEELAAQAAEEAAKAERQAAKQAEEEAAAQAAEEAAKAERQAAKQAEEEAAAQAAEEAAKAERQAAKQAEEEAAAQAAEEAAKAERQAAKQAEEEAAAQAAEEAAKAERQAAKQAEEEAAAQAAEEAAKAERQAAKQAEEEAAAAEAQAAAEAAAGRAPGCRRCPGRR